MIENNFNDLGRRPLSKKKPIMGKPPSKKKVDTEKKAALDSEITAMFERMNSMDRDLRQKLATILELGKRYNIDVERYLDLAKYSPKDIEKVLGMKNALINKITQALPPESCLRKVKHAKSVETMTKERKGKTRGARMKWIPMD